MEEAAAGSEAAARLPADIAFESPGGLGHPRHAAHAAAFYNILYIPGYIAKITPWSFPGGAVCRGGGDVRHKLRLLFSGDLPRAASRVYP